MNGVATTERDRPLSGQGYLLLYCADVSSMAQARQGCLNGEGDLEARKENTPSRIKFRDGGLCSTRVYLIVVPQQLSYRKPANSPARHVPQDWQLAPCSKGTGRAKGRSLPSELDAEMHGALGKVMPDCRFMKLRWLSPTSLDTRRNRVVDVAGHRAV